VPVFLRRVFWFSQVFCNLVVPADWGDGGCFFDFFSPLYFPSDSSWRRIDFFQTFFSALPPMTRRVYLAFVFTRRGA